MMTFVGPLELDEKKIIRFDFSSEVAAGATLSSPAVEVSVYAGTDPSPTTTLSGTPSVSGKLVLQMMQPGLEGVTYRLRATALDSDGQKHGITGFVRVAAG